MTLSPEELTKILLLSTVFITLQKIVFYVYYVKPILLYIKAESAAGLKREDTVIMILFRNLPNTPHSPTPHTSLKVKNAFFQQIYIECLIPTW